MYLFIKYLVVALSLIICVIGILYISKMNKQYMNDTSGSKEDIINYFKEKQATSIDNGIKTKELPVSIAQNPYLLLMVRDKTLSFKKGKYYLNLDK